PLFLRRRRGRAVRPRFSRGPTSWGGSPANWIDWTSPIAGSTPRRRLRDRSGRRHRDPLVAARGGRRRRGGAAAGGAGGLRAVTRTPDRAGGPGDAGHLAAGAAARGDGIHPARA